MKKIIISILIVLLTSCVFFFTYKYISSNNRNNSNINNEVEVNKIENNETDINKQNENEIKKEEIPTIKEKEQPKKESSISGYPALDEIDGEKITIGTSEKGYTIYTKNGVTYIDGIMIVNKSYPLPESYIPTNTHANASGRTNTCNACINEIAYQSFNKMKADAAAIGLNIYIQSGYRPYSTQKTIYNRYVARDGKEAADTYSARPGSSEHQSGLCFDLNSISDAFANTQEGKWVNENAYLYGFIIRFPKGKQNYTGYKYESWHLRYVGADLAKELYNNGNWISLEEYFGITSVYNE